MLLPPILSDTSSLPATGEEELDEDEEEEEEEEDDGQIELRLD